MVRTWFPRCSGTKHHGAHHGKHRVATYLQLPMFGAPASLIGSELSVYLAPALLVALIHPISSRDTSNASSILSAVCLLMRGIRREYVSTVTVNLACPSTTRRSYTPNKTPTPATP